MINLKGCFWKEGINGLGVGPQWLRMFLPYRKKFNDVARLHDECYDINGDEYSRKIYDLLFLYRCMNISNIFIQKIMAIIYYIMLRLFGWMFYRYQK